MLTIEDSNVVVDAGDGGALCVIGDTLLCTDRGGLNVFSLQDPARPHFVRRVGPAPLPRLSNAIVRMGDLACLVGETGNVAPASYLSVFDLSNPAEPRHVSLSRINDRVWCGCAVGRRLYLGAAKQWDGERNGVAVYDLAEPDAPHPVGFVETKLPFHVFSDSSGKRLVAVMDCHLQAFSLADLAAPAPLAPPAFIEEDHYFDGRSAALVEMGGHERLACLQHVFAWEEKGLREIYPFHCWNVGSAIPHHGCTDDGYVALPTQGNVVVLWSAAFARKP